MPKESILITVPRSLTKTIGFKRSAKSQPLTSSFNQSAKLVRNTQYKKTKKMCFLGVTQN